MELPSRFPHLKSEFDVAFGLNTLIEEFADYLPLASADADRDPPTLLSAAAWDLQASVEMSPFEQMATPACEAASDAPRPLSPSAHSGVNPVMDQFKSIIGATPTREALCSLRELFLCTGPITRTQRRQPKAMAAAFEACSTEIMAAMAQPSIMRAVCQILVKGGLRRYDRQQQCFHGLSFLRNAGYL
jgi:hypothetical protein